MKTRDYDSEITTYVDVGNSVLDLVMMDGFPWGAGNNVCFRGGDGNLLRAGEYTFSELRAVSLPDETTYEVVVNSDEEYELPRNTGLEIDCVLVDSFENEVVINVTDLVVIPKINANLIGETELTVSWSLNNVSKSIEIPVSVVGVNFGSVNRSLLDFKCSYVPDDFFAEERKELLSDEEYYFYDVKIQSDDVVPIVTYKVAHNNGIEAVIHKNVFELADDSSLMVKPYISEFQNSDFCITTYRDRRLSDDNYGLEFPNFAFAASMPSLDFDSISSSWKRETTDGTIVYLGTNSKIKFCDFTIIDNGVEDGNTSLAYTSYVTDITNKLWMPFVFSSFPPGYAGYFIPVSPIPYSTADSVYLRKDLNYFAAPIFYHKYPSGNWGEASSMNIQYSYRNMAVVKAGQTVLTITVSYNRLSDQGYLNSYLCSKPLYDFMKKFPKPTGEDFWRLLKYVTNYATNTERCSVVITSSVRSYGLTCFQIKVVVSLNSEIQRTVCVPIYYNAALVSYWSEYEFDGIFLSGNKSMLRNAAEIYPYYGKGLEFRDVTEVN